MCSARRHFVNGPQNKEGSRSEIDALFFQLSWLISKADDFVVQSIYTAWDKLVPKCGAIISQRRPVTRLEMPRRKVRWMFAADSAVRADCGSYTQQHNVIANVSQRRGTHPTVWEKPVAACELKWLYKTLLISCRDVLISLSVETHDWAVVLCCC